MKHRKGKLNCKCPPATKGVCKCSRNAKECRELMEMVEILTADVDKTCSKKPSVPQVTLRLRKSRRVKDTSCVPMKPSLYTRLKFHSHCPDDPMPKPRIALQDEDSPDDCYCDPPPVCAAEAQLQIPTDIRMPKPVPRVLHGSPSMEEVVHVPSPCTSGERVQAQKPTVNPDCVIPPLPPQEMFTLHRPHSGIIMNKDKDYVSEFMDFHGMKLPCPKKKRRKRKSICARNKCPRHRNIRTKPRQPLRYCLGRPKSGKSGAPRRSKRPRRVRDEDECFGRADGRDKWPWSMIKRKGRGRLRKGMFKTHSLTKLACKKEVKPDIRYGILLGSHNMYDERFGAKSRGKQALVMSVTAYCLAFHYHPRQWTTKLVDNLLATGEAWYLQLLEKVHDHEAVRGICEVLPFGKKHALNLNGKKMQVLLGEPEIVGYTMCMDPRIYNLCRALKVFFRQNRAGVMMTRVLKVVIWRDRICYYIFDPAGRDKKGFVNYNNGTAALINVKDVESVAEMLLSRSIVEDQKFVLAPLKVLKMLDEKDDEDLESDVEPTQAEKAMLGYRILTENNAICNGTMHLGDKSFEDAKYRQSLPIALVAMTYAKISPPNTWYSKTVNKILRLGNKLYHDCINPKILADLTINSIPNQIKVGPYVCEIIIYREKVTGQLFTPNECLFNINRGLEEFFTLENCGILEFSNYYLAVWKQKEMFYMYDPYPRTADGLRALQGGKACVMMFLNPWALAEAFTANWDYMPETTPFCVHGFKVLKLRKKDNKHKLYCSLSGDRIRKRVKRRVLEVCDCDGAGGEGAGPRGAGGEGGGVADVDDDVWSKPSTAKISGAAAPKLAEEKMGDIISLVESILEGHVPPIPMRYKYASPDEEIEKPVDLDSPTVSATQVAPPWPRPRDKGNEAPDPDPDPDPDPVDLDSPTVSATQVAPPWPRPRDKSNEAPDPDPDPEPEAPPPPPPPGEGAGEEADEEEEEEDIDEETEDRRAAEKARLAEEKRRAQELPPPLPPPPSPQPEPELAPPPRICEEEIETLEPIEVDRQVLLTEDAKKRYKIRQLRKKAAPPLIEILQPTKTASDELLEPSNFNTLPDSSQIVSGNDFIANEEAQNVMPFVSIMAIVTSYKYSINTWTGGIVDFVVQAGRELYDNKRAKFQFAPMHVIPRIRIGRQTYEAIIDVIAEGPTWKLEEVLNRQFCCRFDRLMVTTCNYSAAIFLRNGLYYLYDASPCNPMGLREDSDVGGACFLRFRTLHDLVTRMLFNKDGKREDQQFVMSRIIVHQLSREPRMQHPDDYEYATGRPRCPNSKTTIAAKPKKKTTVTDPNIGSMVDKKVPIGYQQSECGTYVIEGTTSLGPRSNSDYIQDCHFVSLVAMLLATMHPIKSWDQIMIDVCLEKGLEIADKATNLNICEKRAIRNVIIDGKYINLNIKRIEVINENPERTLDQYLNAVMQRLRYVMIRFPECCLVVCHSDDYYHLFDPYESPIESEFFCGSSYCPSRESVASNGSSKKGDKRPPRTLFNATWSLCPTLDNVLYRIRTLVSPETVEEPEFYNFELTSVKALPKYSALNCKLSPMFKADVNPNAPYLRPKKRCPRIDEKLYWLCSDGVPWSRMNVENSCGFPRRSPRALWNDWDIEVPGDLYSVWGSLHPNHDKYDEAHRGTQYLATCVVALAFTKVCRLSAWTGRLIDGIVDAGDSYHQRCLQCVGEEPNTEITLEMLPKTFELYPYSFKVKFEQIIFGFMYNKLQDRYNLSAALEYFFEAHDTGILVSPSKNLGFGKIAASYFMFDCQSYGVPLFSPDQGVAYMLKCESLNRLIYCMTMTLNVRKHGQVFHLFRVNIRVQSKKDNENQQ